VAQELRDLARRLGVADKVVVQANVEDMGEFFIGARTNTEVGHVLVAGLGGILVELNRHVVGRMLPLDDGDIDAILDEAGGTTVFQGLRGGAAWDRAAVAGALRASGNLASRAASWLQSMDLNPLMCGPQGCVAVDVLMIVNTAS
jgi:hypothetical protein